MLYRFSYITQNKHIKRLYPLSKSTRYTIVTIPLEVMNKLNLKYNSQEAHWYVIQSTHTMRLISIEINAITWL